MNRMMTQLKLGLISGVCILSLSACVSLPNIYLVDRHTVMEAEASGEWPELEQRFKKNSVTNGPVNFSKEPIKRRRDNAFNMLNGEFPVAKAQQSELGLKP